MQKALLVMTSNVINAFTVNNLSYRHTVSLETQLDLFNGNGYKFFQEHEKTLYATLRGLEFAQDDDAWFENQSPPFEHLADSLVCYNFNAENINFSEMLNCWGAHVCTGMGTYAVALRVQYIFIQKPVIKRTLNISGEEEEWTFTFSTYSDDLHALAYQRAQQSLDDRYESFELKTPYSIDDLTKETDLYLKNNPELVSLRNKVERNMLDVKDEHSVYVRLDKEVIKTEDIEEMIESFQVKKYGVFR
jgi:hypothetical protein